ncbi:ribonuclease H-like YkuK family protein [Patescibacteria group bacterium]
MKELFYNSTLKKHINFDEMIKEIVSYINDEPKAKYKITVGTDSPGVNNTFFITAVTILKIGNGGRYFWTKTGMIYCHTLQERIYKEVIRSITFTQELKSKLKDVLGEDFFWPARLASESVAGVDNKIAIHIDIGENGQTKDLIDGVVGMVRGYGFETAIKPEAFCACSVADKHT